MAKSVPFGIVLNNYLKDPERAISYLQSALEENDPDLFRLALRDVAEVQGVLENPSSNLPELSELIASLRRQGVPEDVLTAALTEVNSAVDAA
ncbi:MAG: transcriptional regulator [Cyanobacteria bacterium CAN_BIN43]|jgi:DNA-binding phage protein|nr:transcriptional regulator [Cyanobacteria bacterium CAN_BIN43]